MIILLYYFELLAHKYFNDIIEKYKNIAQENINNKTEKECQELLLNQNLLYLQKALNHIDNVYRNENLEKDSLNNIGKIYSIAYIKLYIFHMSLIYKYNKNKISFSPIIDIISSTNFNTRKVVKIFFLKNFFQYF